MTWSAQLAGHEFDLATFEERYSTGDPKVSRLDDGHLLVQSPALDGATDAPAALQIAADHVRRLNGAARLERPNHHDVTLTGQIRQGERMHAVVLTDTLAIRTHIHTPAVTGGRTTPTTADPTPIDRAAKHPEVGEVLDLLGHPDGPTLSNLYKIFEVIRDDVGGEKGLVSSGLSDKPTMSAFTATANRADISGDDARHVRGPKDPPKRSMTQEEAREFVRGLCDRWMKTKPI